MTLFQFARKNIKRNSSRSFFIILVVMILALLLFVGTFFISGLSAGAKSMADRLGADIIIVPEGYDPHTDNIILTGKPSRAYLPNDILSELKIFDAVQNASPQMFLASLNASCCSAKVQLIGIDYDTDFIIKSWLQKSLPFGRGLMNNEIILGANVNGDSSGELEFFNIPLRIAGRLEATGFNFDNSVFMNRYTAEILFHEAEKIMNRKLSKDGSINSIVMIKLKSGYLAQDVARNINNNLNDKGIYALSGKKFVGNIASTLNLISFVIKIILFSVWIFVIILTGLLFAVSLTERKNEFINLRVIGATRAKILKIILSESLIMSAFGSFLGLILGGILILFSSSYISEILHMPLLISSWKVILYSSFGAFMLSVLSVIISALVLSLRMHKNLTEA